MAPLQRLVAALAITLLLCLPTSCASDELHDGAPGELDAGDAQLDPLAEAGDYLEEPLDYSDYISEEDVGEDPYGGQEDNVLDDVTGDESDFSYYEDGSHGYEDDEGEQLLDDVPWGEGMQSQDQESPELLDDEDSSRETDDPALYVLPEETQNKVDDLLAWFKDKSDPASPLNVALRRSGAVSPSADVLQQDGMPPPRPDLEIYASESCNRGDPILKVPRSLAVASGDVSQSGAVPFKDADADILLAAWLIRAKRAGSGSPFAPFVQALPDYVPLPLLWNDKALEMLDFGPIVRKVKEDVRRVEAAYHKADPASLAHGTLNEFKWAVAIVWSRSLELGGRLSFGGRPGSSIFEEEKVADGENVEGEKELEKDGSSKPSSPAQRFLIPLGDFTPHSFQPRGIWQMQGSEDKESSLQLIATSSLKPGTTISAMYAAADTSKFLMSYGFLPANNPEEHFFVFDNAQHLTTYFSEFWFHANAEDPMAGQPSIQVIPPPLTNLTKRNWALDIAAILAEISESGKGGKRATFLGRAVAVAKDAAEEVLGRHQHFLDEISSEAWFILDNDRTFAFGAGGAIDPRLWAAAAACAFVRDQLHVDPAPQVDIVMLADLALRFAHEEDGLSCKNLKAVLRHDYPSVSESEAEVVAVAFEGAAKFLKGVAQAWLDAFKTTAAEDRELLTASEQCISKDSDGQQDSQSSISKACIPPKEAALTLEEKLAIRFRINRKTVLLQVMNVLDDACFDDHDVA